MVTENIAIGKRLKAFRELTKTKMPAISAATGITIRNLYNWENGTQPSNAADYLRLKFYLDKMEGKQDEDIKQIEIHKTDTLRLPLNRSRVAIPQTDGTKSIGTVMHANNEPELIVGRIDAPILGHLEGLVEVRGDSMAPTFPNGSFIAIRRMNDFRILNWGSHYYIIDINGYGRIRKVYQGDSDGCPLLHCDNSNDDLYPPMQMQWDQILAILDIPVRMIKS